MNHKLHLIALLILASCSTGRIVTTNLNDLATYEPNGHVYMLPKTRVIVTIYANKMDFIPGPYHKYAKKYLGISGAKSVSETFYEITDIRLNTHSIPDPDHCYSIRDEKYGNVNDLLNEYRNSGLIMKESAKYFQNTNLEKLEKGELIEYTNLSIKPFITNGNSNAVKVKQDKKIEKTPLLAKQVSPKTIEEKANEAAKFIYKLRKRRFKLLAGQYEVYPEGIALKTSIEELDKLEEEYLSLFIGKDVSTSVSRTYLTIPSENEGLQRFTLLRFSEETGFHTATGRIGEAIILQISDLETNKTLSQLQQTESASQNNDIIFYRIADIANAKLFFGSHEVLEAEIPVFQMGALIPKYIPPIKNRLFRSN